MNQAGFTQIAIGKAISFSQGTIRKELSRNKGKRGDRSIQAHRLASERQRKKRSRPRVVTGAVKGQVDARLLCKHRPYQISNGLSTEGIQVSHEAIYRYIEVDPKAGGGLWRELRINGKRRYRRRSKVGRGEKIPGRVDIDPRPAEVSARTRYGDWEADLIQGAAGSGYLLSVYERKSRLGKLFKLSGKSSSETARGLLMVLSGFRVHTVTYDNGLEFSMHELVNTCLDSESYFCKPYSSWEKGGVENFNGLVRQYFPKGSDFGSITGQQLQAVEDEINDRPRNVHGYRHPNDYLGDLLA